MKTRIEEDALGKRRVPAEAYYGIQTLRAVENFQISGRTLPHEMVVAMAQIKVAAAKTHRDLGLLKPRVASAIQRARPDQPPLPRTASLRNTRLHVQRAVNGTSVM